MTDIFKLRTTRTTYRLKIKMAVLLRSVLTLSSDRDRGSKQIRCLFYSGGNKYSDFNKNKIKKPSSKGPYTKLSKC